MIQTGDSSIKAKEKRSVHRNGKTANDMLADKQIMAVLKRIDELQGLTRRTGLNLKTGLDAGQGERP